MKQQLLRYQISSWQQLPNCLSNTSRELHVHVANIVNSPNLSGLRISIEHDRYGTLFTYMAGCGGELIDITPEADISTEQILGQLRQFGFLVQFSPESNLPSSQLEYMLTLRKLHYDKIRILNVWKPRITTEKEFKQYVVAFQSSAHKFWLNREYSPSEDEFTEGLINGTAINLTDISKTKRYNWSWLKEYVANIDDVVRDQIGDVTTWPSTS